MVFDRVADGKTNTTAEVALVEDILDDKSNARAQYHGRYNVERAFVAANNKILCSNVRCSCNYRE